MYATPRPLPRAGVVGAQQVVAGEEAQLAAVLEPGFDGRRTVVTERAAARARATRRASGPPAAPGSCEHEPERVVVDATARRAGELVLTDLHYPGWKVELDGEPADLHRVDYLLRGTTLPAGPAPRGVHATSRCRSGRVDRQPAGAAGAGHRGDR